MLTSSAGTRSFLGWQSKRIGACGFRSSGDFADAGAAFTAWYFFVVAALFLVQTLLGGATAHYHAETGGFFGFDLARVLPYNLARTWHLNWRCFLSPLFWRPGFSRAADRRLRTARPASLSHLLLLAALVVVVVGSLAGEAASYKGLLEGARAVPRRRKGGSISISAGYGRCF